MNSIQSRLASGLVISLIVILLLLWVSVSNNIQKLAENYIASRLEHDIETLLTAITFDQQNQLLVNDQRIDAIYNRPFSGHYYSIQHKQTIIRSRALWDQALTIPEINATGYHQTYQQGPEHQSLIVITSQFHKQDQDIIISVAEDLTPVENDIEQFKYYFAIISFAILLALILAQSIILRSGLKPLRQIRKELHELEKGHITELTTDVPFELKSVVSEINQLSLALYKRLKRSRDALSDLSHAIKKPLTLLQQFSDKHQASLDDESIKTLNKQIDSIQQITDRILKRARVAGRSRLNRVFSIQDDLPVLIKTINTMYPDKHIKTTLDVPDNLATQIDSEDMLELLGNLLDNAWKWAKGEIHISIQETDILKITIEDDGAGSKAESLNELANRGVRLDESVSGYGFGLAISSDIVKDYDGSLLFSQSDSLGGFKSEINLPTNG